MEERIVIGELGGSKERDSNGAMWLLVHIEGKVWRSFQDALSFYRAHSPIIVRHSRSMKSRHSTVSVNKMQALKARANHDYRVAAARHGNP